MPGETEGLIRVKIAKAAEFLFMAELSGDEHFDVAVSLAASAAINASDILCLLGAGNYYTGQNHGEAVTMLRKAGYQQASTHLVRAIAAKSKAQYSGSRCTEHEANMALTHARRLFNSALSESKKRGMDSA